MTTRWTSADLSAHLAKEDKVKKPKYGNKAIWIDGIYFHSTKEGRRYEILRLMERAGGISDLKLQVTFALAVNGRAVCRYKADFTYLREGVLIVEDTKGVRTAAYMIKKKLMRAVHGIEILET
jgi:hypothetical protein